MAYSKQRGRFQPKSSSLPADRLQVRSGSGRGADLLCACEVDLEEP